MELLLGPPGAGKTDYCLTVLRDSPLTTRLIVPATTLAEHLRNKLAREGVSFRPSSIVTFSKFVEPYLPAAEEVTLPALEILVGQVLDREPPDRYARVHDFPGFRRAMAAAIDEYATAGGCTGQLDLSDPAFAAVFRAVAGEMKKRSWIFRADRLTAADAAPHREHLLFAGFYSFTTPELRFLEGLQAQVTVTLPEWAGSAQAIARLAPRAKIRRLESNAARAARFVTAAPTIESEVNEVARQILAASRPFRQIGVVLRSEQPYVSALQDAFERYGIPARFYFGSRLKGHAAVRYLLALVDAALSGWDYEKTLGALRLPGGPLESGGDAFEFEMRCRVPGVGAHGWPGTIDKTLLEIGQLLDGTRYPQQWADAFEKLAAYFQHPSIGDRVSHEQVLLWRSTGDALTQWILAVQETARIVDPSPSSCAAFRDALELVLGSIELRTPDHRRDVVHVIDPFEARQWKLPLLFVCGMVEKQFPKYHAENAILGDAARRRLQAAGVELRTSLERQADEQFLFDTLLTRADEKIAFTYPELNAKYDANLKSFLLERTAPYTEERVKAVRPAPLRSRFPEPQPTIYDESLRRHLQDRHARIGATSIELYLQCPYQFFAEKTLRLQPAPESPYDRLNLMVQGSIVHSVLERCARERLPVEPVFDEVWEQVCAAERIPSGYRSEAVRLEMLHNLEMFAADQRLRPGVESLFEQDVDLELHGARIGCRIDRIEVDANGYATVIDYKYRVASGIEKTKKGHAKQTNVQGGLYLMAAAQLGYEMGGMVYCGMKKEVSFGGWLVSPCSPELSQSCNEDQLREIVSTAHALTVQAAGQILDGRIVPQPADEARCERCHFVNICRVDIAAIKKTLRAGEAHAAQR